MRTTLKLLMKGIFVFILVFTSCKKNDLEDVSLLEPIAAENGVNGTSGTDGNDVTNGTNGTDGANGTDGTDGEDGADGQDGADGEQGPQGEQGPMGPAGADGQDGEDGVDGEQGPVGPAGPAGADGEDGNANVTAYSYSGFDFGTSERYKMQLSNITKANFEKTAWFVYLLRGTANMHLIPGIGHANDEFSVLIWHKDGKGNFQIDLEEGSGSNYSGVRIIGIQANNSVTGGKSEGLPDIDFSDYYTVMDYYGLKY